MIKGQPFKPTLYKSYCEGSFTCEPNIIIGPLNNRVPTIGAVCGEACAWHRWRFSQLSSKQRFAGFPPSSVTCSCCSNINLCQGLRPAAPTARAVLGASDLKPTLPAVVKGLTCEKSKQVLKKVLDRTKALHGPRTQAYGETKYTKEKTKVLDRTKVLHGPRTQAYGETKYTKEKTKVLDRTKALHGPRTQAYEKTKYVDGESPRLNYCKRLRPVRVLRRWRNAPLFSSLRRLFILRVTCPQMVTSYTALNTQSSSRLVLR